MTDETSTIDSLITIDPNFESPAPAAVPTSFTGKHAGNPYTTMVKLIDNQWGPCPISAGFPMHGGTLVINFSANAHTDTTMPPGTIAVVGYQILVDNVVVGTAQTMITDNQWGTCSTDLVVENLQIGDHTVTIQPYGQLTSNDQFNIFNLTVLEF